MTLVEYQQKLSGADWFYQMTEDPRVFREGQSEIAKMKFASNQSPNHAILYNEWQNYINSMMRSDRVEKPSLAFFIRTGDGIDPNARTMVTVPSIIESLRQDERYQEVSEDEYLNFI